jgi:hypothetical protein
MAKPLSDLALESAQQIAVDYDGPAVLGVGGFFKIRCVASCG